jgi:hypothetical protein
MLPQQIPALDWNVARACAYSSNGTLVDPGAGGVALYLTQRLVHTVHFYGTSAHSRRTRILGNFTTQLPADI